MSAEKTIHERFADLAKEIANTDGILVKGIRFEYICDTSMRCEKQNFHAKIAEMKTNQS